MDLPHGAELWNHSVVALLPLTMLTIMNRNYTISHLIMKLLVETIEVYLVLLQTKDTQRLEALVPRTQVPPWWLGMALDNPQSRRVHGALATKKVYIFCLNIICMLDN